MDPERTSEHHKRKGYESLSDWTFYGTFYSEICVCLFYFTLRVVHQTLLFIDVQCIKAFPDYEGLHISKLVYISSGTFYGTCT